jgi:hypothetical protein
MVFFTVEKMAEISANTIYARILVQISAALIGVLLALPFFRNWRR